MNFKWESAYETGNADIDFQHRQLIEIGARLEELLTLGASVDRYDEITAALEEMVSYTKKHFTFEEGLLEEVGYPKLVEHKFEHKYFIKSVEKLLDEDLDMNHDESIIKIVGFIQEWVVHHIVKTDLQYKGVI